MDRRLSISAIAAGLLAMSCCHAATSCPSLLALVRSELQKTNPHIETVRIFEMRGWYDEYFVLAHGIKKDEEFKGAWNDELFGVFLVDGSLCRTLATIDVFPTPRWNDYEIHIAKISDYSLVIKGNSIAYGGSETKKYAIDKIDRHR
jgi:hypothetical protein